MGSLAFGGILSLSDFHQQDVTQQRYELALPSTSQLTLTVPIRC